MRQLRLNAQFESVWVADACRAEYKRVTVLFADVVHSMDSAAAVGAERLREIITDLVARATTVIERYGGTVDKFTGDGIMALFGAPKALEDHAIDLIRSVIDGDLAAGITVAAGAGTTLLVESLLRRGGPGDLEEAEAAVERLAAEPVEPGFVLYDLPLLRLRALVAQARGDDQHYLDYRDRYRAMAHQVDFKPHIATAEAMP